MKKLAKKLFKSFFKMVVIKDMLVTAGILVVGGSPSASWNSNLHKREQ